MRDGSITMVILYSSLKYHRLHPEYIAQRIDTLGSSYNLRILLILCDIVGRRAPRFFLSRFLADQSLDRFTTPASPSTKTRYEN